MCQWKITPLIDPNKAIQEEQKNFEFEDPNLIRELNFCILG